MSTASTNPKYGKGEVTLSLEDQLDSGVAEFGEELSKLFSSPRYQPPALPAVALKVMALARRPKVEFEELAKTIEQDSLLAAKVMTRAESVMYSGQNPVRSLRQAAVRMGVGGLRDLVIEVAMNLRVFRSPGLEKQKETLIAVICVAQDLAGQIGASMDGVMPGEEEQRKAESVGDHTPREALLRARDSLRLTPAQDALMEKDLAKLKETLGAGF